MSDPPQLWFPEPVSFALFLFASHEMASLFGDLLGDSNFAEARVSDPGVNEAWLEAVGEIISLA